MAGTRLVEVRTVVIDGLAARPMFAEADAKGHKPRLSLGWAVGKKDREKVYTQDARFTHEPASMRAGRTYRHEVGYFTLVIRVEGVGQDVATSSARAVELGTDAEEFLADHRTGLDVVGLNWIEVSGDGELAEMFNEHGSLSILSYPVKYDARLE